MSSRGIAGACTSYAQSVGTFPDVDAQATHAGAIDCLAQWGIVRGREGPAADPVYEPGDVVDRAAMASYVVRALERLPAVTVPEPSDERFDDYASGTHADNVHVLRAANIVQGREDGSYGPSEPVTRAAMASFIARALDYLAFRGYLPVAFEIAVAPASEQPPNNLNQRIAGTVDDQFGRGSFSDEVRFEVYRDGVLVLSSNQISGLGGDIDLRYNAGADEGDTDEVVACIVEPGAATSDAAPFCLDTDREPVEGRRVTQLSFTWGELAVADTAPDEGQFFGMAINLDADDNVLGFQTLPSPPIPSEAPIGDFLIVEYVTDANFIVNGATNVPEAQFECAVQASIADERNGHLINISVGPDSWNSYALSTSSDVSACSSS